MTLLASALRTAGTVDGATVMSGELAHATAIVFELNISAQTGTTIDVAVEASLDGTNWFIIAKFSQTGAATGIKYAKAYHNTTFATEVAPVAAPAVSGAFTVNNFAWDKYWRASYVLVGTNYTFSVLARPFYCA